MSRAAMFAAALMASAAATAPATAQDHSAHQGHTMPAPAAEPEPDPEAMRGMDHSAMHHGDTETLPETPPEAPPEIPPPPGAGSGPPRAADAIWGAAAMQASRRELAQMHGDFPVFWLQADRAELRARGGTEGYLWDAQAYYGGPTSRLWFKSQGEGSFGEKPAEAEFQALYARAIAPFFDVQAGIRQDFAWSDSTYAVIGIQGLAPYRVAVETALFLSQRGDLTARVEAEVDQRITRRLILQPRAELNLAAQDVPQLGLGAGITAAELGLRLRYEIAREFAPYIGIEQSWRTGRTADLAHARGEDASTTNYAAGIVFRF